MTSSSLASRCRHSVALFIATAAFSGRAPRAPGTVTSAAVALLYAVLLLVCPAWFGGWLLGTIIVCMTLGVWSVAHLLRDHQDPDPAWITIDEVAGMACACLWMLEPLPFSPLMALAISFGAFRLLDILKPGPIGWVDRTLKEDAPVLGVMLDDLFAGGVVSTLGWICLKL